MMNMSACALAKDTKEITFQGVPWFSSPSDVNKVLGESGFTNGKAFRVRTLKDKSSLLKSHIAKYSKDKKVPYKFSDSKKDTTITTKLLKQWQNNVKKTIAKQQVERFYAYYTAEPDNPRLVEFLITLSKNDGKYDQKAIYNALKKAFGKPTTVRDGKEYIWLGKNNTIAILKQTNVVFATLDGLEYAETIELDFDEPEDTGF